MTPDTEFEAVILSKVTKKHVVWATQGDGLPLAEFGTLEKALAYAEENKGEMVLGIMRPNGEWHKNG